MDDSAAFRFRGSWLVLSLAVAVAACSRTPQPSASQPLGVSAGAGGVAVGPAAAGGVSAGSHAGAPAAAGRSAGAAGVVGSAGRAALNAGQGGGGTAAAAGVGAVAGASGATQPAAGGGAAKPPGDGSGFYRMEPLQRGVVALQTSAGTYVGWRMFGFEYDPEHPEATHYELYRDGVQIADVTDSTNYLDPSGSATAQYSVRAVVGGTRSEPSESVKAWPVAAGSESGSYWRIPLQPPAAGYSANDASVGDADGDGHYEIVLKWDPDNSKDNSQSGVTGNVYLDVLALDGTRLTRLDLGPNIRAGAHYTQFIVYDFDGDGKAEIAVKTAPGTKAGDGQYLKLGPAANDDDSKVYRNSDGYILSGPEYLSVFSAETGAELATTAFDVPRGDVSAWGDDYGNRVDRFLAAAAYLDDTGLPSFVMARGYYTRTTLTAWNWRSGKLSQLWKFDSNATPRDAQNRPYTGQGSHSLSVANVDADPQQEIMYGAMAIDHDGRGLCSTGNGHGDALHVSDFLPDHPGLEAFMPNEDGKHPAYYMRAAGSCEILFAGPVDGNDTGRAAAGDISPDNPGAEAWAAGTDLLDGATGERVGDKPASVNFLIWWDADESRELEDKTAITKYGGATLLSCSQCASNNGTKSTPALVADLIGDWREEVLWREADNSALRLYTTSTLTKRRIYTLMHDPQYRAAIAWQNVGYNQPPHPSFHIGAGMKPPPKADIRTR